MANYASSIRPVGANALDPDTLENTFAGQLRSPDAGFLLPFYFGAQMARQQRGQTLIDANATANAQAGELARQEMAAEDMRSRRTLVSSLAERGFPVSDPQVMSQLGLDPATSAMVASIGNTMIQSGARAQALEREATAARQIAEAGGQPGNTQFAYVRGPFGSTPTVQAAAARGARETQPRIQRQVDPNGNVTDTITGPTPEAVDAMSSRVGGNTPQMQARLQRAVSEGAPHGIEVRSVGVDASGRRVELWQNGRLIDRGVITRDGQMIRQQTGAPSTRP